MERLFQDTLPRMAEKSVVDSFASMPFGKSGHDCSASWVAIMAAGFGQVDFMPEPVAAAIASGAMDQSGEIGLIVDIGGGTSDFSLFRSGREGVEILANHGIRMSYCQIWCPGDHHAAA